MPKRARSRQNSTTDIADLPNFQPAERATLSTPPRDPLLAYPNTKLSNQAHLLPLTRENLAKHIASSIISNPLYLPSPSMSVRSGSPTRNAWDTRATLLAYRINVDSSSALPSDLQSHLDIVLLCKRDGPRSPNAGRVVKHRLAASLDNESTGIRRLEPLLLFAGEDDPGAANAVPLISSKLDFNLSRRFLPPQPPDKTLPRLSQPQADTIIGYLSSLQATEPTLQTAFTPDEEAVLADFTLNPVLVFPFLSSQWKAATGEPHLIAHYQSARDGVAIVRYLDEYYKTAYGRAASTLECAHVSFTCDIQALNIWLHWRELDSAGVETHYMKSIFDCTLRNEKHLSEARQLLWNHIDYTLGNRLRSLRNALHPFSKDFLNRLSKPAKSSRSSRTSA